VVETQRTAETVMTDEQLLKFSRSITNDEKRWQVPEKGEKFDVENEIDDVVTDSFDAFQDQYEQYVKIMSDPALEKYRPDAERWLEIGSEAYERETKLKSGIAENVFASLDKDKFATFHDEYDNPPVVEAEYTQRFLEAFKAMWKDRVATHQRGEITTTSDLDGNSSLLLLQKIAGLDLGKVEYIEPGTYSEGKINIDTGNKDAVGTDLFDRESADKKETSFIDHHGNESDKDTSATLWVYDILNEMNLIKEDGVEIILDKRNRFTATPEDIKKFVEIVTHDDNKDFPDMDKYYENYPNSYKTMMGLLKYIYPEYLLRFISDGRDLFDELSDDDLKKYHLIHSGRLRDKDNKIIRNDDGTFVWRDINYRDVRKRQIEESLEKVKELAEPAKGFVLESEDFGRIFVDLSDSVGGKDEASKSLGFDTYILWNSNLPADKTGFFITSKKGIPFDFRPSEGKNVRGRIVIKKGEEGTSDLTLHDILTQMGVDDAQLRGELKDYIDTQDIDHAEVAAKLDAERREALKVNQIEVQGSIIDDPDGFVDAIKYYEGENAYGEREKRRVMIERSDKFWQVIYTKLNPINKRIDIFFREYDPIVGAPVGEKIYLDMEDTKTADALWYRGPERGVVVPSAKSAASAEPIVKTVAPIIPVKPEPVAKTLERNFEKTFDEAFAIGSEWELNAKPNSNRVSSILGLRYKAGDTVEIKILDDTDLTDVEHSVEIRIIRLDKSGHEIDHIDKNVLANMLILIAHPKNIDEKSEFTLNAQKRLSELTAAANSREKNVFIAPKIEEVSENVAPVIEETELIPEEPIISSAETTDEIDLKLLKAGDLIEPRDKDSLISGFETDQTNMIASSVENIKISYKNIYSIDDLVPGALSLIKIKVIAEDGSTKFFAVPTEDLSTVFQLATPRQKTADDIINSPVVNEEADDLSKYFAPLDDNDINKVGAEPVAEPEEHITPSNKASEKENANPKDYSLVENAVSEDSFVFDIFEDQGGPLKLEVGQKWSMSDADLGQDTIEGIDYLKSSKNDKANVIAPNIDRLAIKFKLADGQEYEDTQAISWWIDALELYPEFKAYQAIFQGKEVVVPEEDTNE